VFLRRWKNKDMARDEYEQDGSLRVYASSRNGLLDDLASVIAEAAGESSEHEPTKVVGRVDLDAFEAHAGAVKSVNLYEPHPERPAPRVPVRPQVQDLESVQIGPKQVAIVRIVPARDRVIVRAAAIAGLLLAIGFVLFLLAL
jgi:hypothetical protein